MFENRHDKSHGIVSVTVKPYPFAGQYRQQTFLFLVSSDESISKDKVGYTKFDYLKEKINLIKQYLPQARGQYQTCPEFFQ